MCSWKSTSDRGTASGLEPFRRPGVYSAWMAAPLLAPELVPDLLEAQPRFRIDPETTDVALVFAFAGSSSGGLFSEALRKAELPRSCFSPQAYADELFLSRLVSDCFVGPREYGTLLEPGYVARLIAAPPDDVRSVELRRGILAELVERPELRTALTDLHRHLARLRALLEGTGGGLASDPGRRQVEVLEHLGRTFELCESGFSSATSGLARLAAFGVRVRGGEGYRTLVELLAHDERLATIDLRVRIGGDGRVRELAIGRVAENADNPFTNPPLRRWLSRLELLWRGFSLREGEVMARLLDAVFEGIRAELPALVQLLGDVEFYLGALRFRALAEAQGLSVCLPEFGPPEAPRQLLGLFNPLLLGAGVRPVPCDVTTDRADTTLLVTGPNSGGKTRLLQSFGIAQLLAQSGLFVPARAAKLTWATGLMVSLTQENAADQPEGRLGMELVRIRALFERLPHGAIVILDELCSGTNPSEGEEIFELVVRMLSRLRPQAYITTHFLAFAARLERERRIDDLRFLQVMLGKDHTPTYQFGPGVATTSLAGRTAERLGVTADQLLSLIDQRVGRGG